MAISRASVVAVRILSGQSAGGSGALKYVTPRHVVVKPTFESLQLRIEAPALGAGICVERGDDVAREADVERVADLQRRCLERAADAGAIGPRDLQLVDVRRVDLVERHVARARGGAAPVLPIARTRSASTSPELAANGSVGYGWRIATAMQIATSPTMAIQLIGTRAAGAQLTFPARDALSDAAATIRARGTAARAARAPSRRSPIPAIAHTIGAELSADQ